MLTQGRRTTSCYKKWSSDQCRFHEIELCMCYKLIAFCCTQLILLSLRDLHQYWFSLIFAVFVFCLTATWMYNIKSLGLCCSSIWICKEAAVTGYRKEMYLFLTSCGICFTGDDDFDQEHCTKALLRQIQQLFLNIAVFCSTVLCQFSFLSPRRMYIGELIHQSSD